MKTCPKCQREYPDTSTFCGNDGVHLMPLEVPTMAAVAPSTTRLPSDTPPASATPLRSLARPPVNRDSKQTLGCPKCRKPITEADTFCPHCGSATSALRIQCPHCGQEHPATQRFCPKSGQRIGPRSRTPLPEQRGLLIAVAAIVLLVGGYFGYQHFIATGDKPPEQSNMIDSGLGQSSVPAVTNGISGSGDVQKNRPPIPIDGTSAREVENKDVLPLVPPKISILKDGRPNASSAELPYVAANAFDGNPATFWHADEADHEPWISVKYPSERYITEIGMIVGRQGAWFYKNGRVKDIRLHFSNGETQDLRFDDVRYLQFRTLPKPFLTRSVQIVIVSVYHGATHHITIPEIAIRGYEQ